MSFIQDYLKTTENSKPAKEYHIWSMLSCLSTFAGRRFWFPFGPIHFFPNLYVVLVGDPANGKSTAMNRAKGIVRKSEICPVAPTQITKEALTLSMGNEKFPGKKFFTHDTRQVEYNQYAVFATELVEFIAVNPEGFLDFLTTVWDESVLEIETKNKGKDYVLGPYITMLACLTPEKMKGYLKLSILTGGFARRTAFVYAPGYNIVHIPSYTPEQQAAELRCIEFGKALQKRSGEFTWSDECRDFYIEWNTNNEKTIRDRHPTVRGWYSSKAEILFKLSMLLCLANDPEGPLCLEVPHYKLALHYCGLIEPQLPRVFEGTGINPNSVAIGQVVRMLEELGRPMPRKQLDLMFMDNATSLRELQESINHLVLAGRLAERQVMVNAAMVTVIGTPETIALQSDEQLKALFQKRAVLPPPSCTDLTASFDPSKPLTDPPVRLVSIVTRETGTPAAPPADAPSSVESSLEYPPDQPPGSPDSSDPTAPSEPQT